MVIPDGIKTMAEASAWHEKVHQNQTSEWSPSISCTAGWRIASGRDKVGGMLSIGGRRPLTTETGGTRTRLFVTNFPIPI